MEGSKKRKGIADEPQARRDQLNKINENIARLQKHLEPAHRAHDNKSRWKLERLINLRARILGADQQGVNT